MSAYEQTLFDIQVFDIQAYRAPADPAARAAAAAAAEAAADAAARVALHMPDPPTAFRRLIEAAIATRTESAS